MNFYPMNTLGQRIRFARGTVSQDIFSSRISVSKGSLGGYERDENLPNTDIVLKICSETGISVLWLLTGKENPRPEAPPTERQESPPHALRTGAETCVRCAKLEKELEQEREERRAVSVENRQWAAKTEQLLRENGALRERCATLTERQNSTAPDGGFSKQMRLSSNNLLLGE